MMKTNKARALGIASATVINQTVMASISMMVTTILVVIASAVNATAEQTVLIATFTALGSIIGYAITGTLIAKYNPKILGFIGSFAILLYTWCLAYSPNIYLIYVTSAIYAMAIPITYLTISQTMLTKWINKGRGVIMTSTWSIYSIINIFLSPVLVNAVETKGREVIFIFGIVGFVVVALSCLIFFQKDPECYGMEPADFTLKEKEKKTILPDAPYESAMPAKHVFKTVGFYLMILVPTLSAFAYMMFYSNMSFIFTASGLTVTQIALTVSVLNLSAMITVPMFGALCDKIGLKWTYTIWCIPVIVGMLIILFVKNMVGACIGMFMISFINAFSFYYPFAATKLFGTNKVGQVVAWGNSIAGIPNMFASIICAAIAKAAGGYTIPILIAVGLLVIDVLLCHISLGNRVIESVKRADQRFQEAKL